MAEQSPLQSIRWHTCAMPCKFCHSHKKQKNLLCNFLSFIVRKHVAQWKQFRSGSVGASRTSVCNICEPLQDFDPKKQSAWTAVHRNILQLEASAQCWFGFWHTQKKEKLLCKKNKKEEFKPCTHYFINQRQFFICTKQKNKPVHQKLSSQDRKHLKWRSRHKQKKLFQNKRNVPSMRNLQSNSFLLSEPNVLKETTRWTCPSSAGHSGTWWTLVDPRWNRNQAQLTSTHLSIGWKN